MIDVAELRKLRDECARFQPSAYNRASEYWRGYEAALEGVAGKLDAILARAEEPGQAACAHSPAYSCLDCTGGKPGPTRERDERIAKEHEDDVRRFEPEQAARERLRAEAAACEFYRQGGAQGALIAWTRVVAAADRAEGKEPT